MEFDQYIRVKKVLISIDPLQFAISQDISNTWIDRNELAREL